MVDQNSQFFAILTNVGAAKQANADALGIAWKITQMAVGDANGTDPTPNPAQKALINEWRRAPLNQLKVDDNDASIIVAEQVIPADIGGKWIREIGLYDADGDLVAVANCAPTYKPVLSQGSGRTQVLRMSLVVSNAANVQLKIDPSVVLATREWVTEELARQDFKHSVLAATTANITLSGLQTIDGVALTAGARVLVKNQTAAKDNGLYTVVSGALWTRCADADSSAKVTPGLLVHVEKGTVNSDSAWQLVTDAPITLGVTALAYEMAFGRTGVTAGTYRSVQVDKYGRVVAATNPTTVAGYGITDVYTKSETFTKTEVTSAITDAVSKAVAGLVDSSPGALDTLKELAAALGNDPNYAATMVAEMAKKAPLISPKLTGTPEAPTAPIGTNTPQIATMAAIVQALAAFGIGTSIIPLTDNVNNLVEGGLFRTTNTTANIPVAASGCGVHIPFGGGPALQLWGILSAGTGARLFWRASASNWSGWNEITKLDSPALTGNPTAPTQAVGDNDTSIATTGFVQAALAAFGIAARSTNIADLNALKGTCFFGANHTSVGAPESVSAYDAIGWQVEASGQRTQFMVSSGLKLQIRTDDSADYSGFEPWGELVTLDALNTLATTITQQLAAKAPLASPALTGTPTAPTATKGTNTTQLATTAFVQAALATLIDAAPGALDTLKELADALGNDPNFAGSMISKLAEKAALLSPALTGIPTAPTAPVGTNTTQLATMAALLQGVNAFKRNYTGNVVGVAADTTLTASQTGYSFNVTAPVTVTLPSATDAGSGGTFVFRNVSSGVVTITVPAGGRIYEKNNSVTSAAIQPGEWIELQASTTSYFINQRGTLGEINKIIADAMASFGIGGYNVKAGVDINTLTVGGITYCINPTNSPVGTAGTSSANGYVLSFQYMDGTTYCAQVFIPSLVGASLDSMHFRRMTAGVFGGWKTVATTEFVQGAISNSARSFKAQAVIGVAVNLALNTTTHLGAIFQFNANGLTATLPSAATVTDGSVVTFRNPRAAAQTLAVAAGSVVEEGVTNDKLTLQAYEWIEMISSGVAWFVSARGKLREGATVDTVAALLASRDVGKVFFHAAITPPAGALKANGAAVSRTTYAALFAVIGTTHGAGDGSTTFNLPDVRAEFVRGLDDGRGIDSGRSNGSKQGQMLENHGHPSIGSILNGAVSNASGQPGSNTVLSYGDPAADVVLTTGNPTSGTRGAETRPRNIALLGCINYM